MLCQGGEGLAHPPRRPLRLGPGALGPQRSRAWRIGLTRRRRPRPRVGRRHPGLLPGLLRRRLAPLPQERWPHPPPREAEGPWRVGRAETGRGPERRIGRCPAARKSRTRGKGRPIDRRLRPLRPLSLPLERPRPIPPAVPPALSLASVGEAAGTGDAQAFCADSSPLSASRGRPRKWTMGRASDRMAKAMLPIRMVGRKERSKSRRGPRMTRVAPRPRR